MVKAAGKPWVSRGTCELCHKKFKHSEMTVHLRSCLKKHETPAPSGTEKGAPAVKGFHLIVEGHYASAYWMHLQVRADGMLEDLDRFLRHTWLECCGHMSRFSIGKKSYSVNPMTEYGEDTMELLLGEVLRPRMKFSHEYDYGSTTHLALRVVSGMECSQKQRPIRLLARNEPPPIECNSCGKKAVFLCGTCSWEGMGWLCKACADKHDCDDEGFLPVVNSPRVGVCGYTGEAW